jgi:hypothetical protein
MKRLKPKEQATRQWLGDSEGLWLIEPLKEKTDRRVALEGLRERMARGTTGAHVNRLLLSNLPSGVLLTLRQRSRLNSEFLCHGNDLALRLPIISKSGTGSHHFKYEFSRACSPLLLGRVAEK